MSFLPKSALIFKRKKIVTRAEYSSEKSAFLSNSIVYSRLENGLHRIVKNPVKNPVILSANPLINHGI